MSKTDLKGDSSHKNRINNSMVCFLFTMRLVGFVPYTFNDIDGTYEAKWFNLAGLQTMITGFWITSLAVMSVIGLITMDHTYENLDLSSLKPEALKYIQERKQLVELEIMAVILVVNCIINAWAELMMIVLNFNQIGSFLTEWNLFDKKTKLNPTPGVKISSLLNVIMTYVMAGALVITTLLDKPLILGYLLDGIAEVVFLVPSSWLVSSRLCRQVNEFNLNKNE